MLRLYSLPEFPPSDVDILHNLAVQKVFYISDIALLVPSQYPPSSSAVGLNTRKQRNR
jgi:hypothetical protein